MNIEKISQHLSFNKIFSECRKDNGKIDWLKVASYPDLPVELIDQYFLKLKSVQFERYQKLNDYIIKTYKYQLNWYIVITNQDLSEELLNENIDIFDRLRLWPLLLKYQHPSITFLINNLSRIKENHLERFIDSSPTISDEDKRKIKSLL